MCPRAGASGDFFTAEALSADGVKKSASGDHQAQRILKRIVVDMARDMMDVQFYAGEYAMKKFEVARDMLPELYAGLCRLKEQLQAEEAPDAIASQPANTAEEASASVPAAPPRTLSFYHILFLFCFFVCLCCRFHGRWQNRNMSRPGDDWQRRSFEHTACSRVWRPACSAV